MADSSTLRPLLGFFVGGRGTRLGGVAKGNLTLPNGQALLERLAAECRRALPHAAAVLVGAAEAYGALGLTALSDEPPGIGPLGGLRSLIAYAERAGYTHALALSCDLPYLGAALVARLASEAPEADFLAPRAGELWQTLVARYSVLTLPAVDATIAAGDRALQRVVQRLGERAVELGVDEQERLELRDWDEPADAPR